jgi:hypothetical protein
MNSIFISYRREDTLVYADRLQEDVAGHFGADEVFRDMDTIEPGSDFVAAIDGALSETEIMLVVIGPKWLGPEGRRHLHETGDYVRAEVAAGLRSPRVRVIPVLVGGARMPAEDELPAEISSLTRRNAFEMIDTRWRADRAELFRRIDEMLAEDEDEDEADGRRDDEEDGDRSRAGEKDEKQRGLRTPTIVGGILLAGAVAGILLAVLLRGSGGEAGPPAEPGTATATVPASPAQGALAWQLADAAGLGGPDDQQMTDVVSPLQGASPPFVAVGSRRSSEDQDGAVWTSTDGNVWKAVAKKDLATGGDQQMLGLAFWTKFGRLVAGGYDASGNDADAALWISEDASSWDRISVPAERGVNELINRVNETRVGLVGAGWRTGGSTDGEDGAIWILGAPGASVELVSDPDLGGPGDQRVNRVVQLAAGRFVAVGLDQGRVGVWVSADARSWDRVPSPALRGKDQEILDAVAFGESGIVAVGRAGQDGSVWFSRTGEVWNRAPDPEDAFAAGNGSVLVSSIVASEPAATSAGAPPLLAGGVVGSDAAVWTSRNGRAWAREPGAEGGLDGEGARAIEDLTAKGSPVVAVGSIGESSVGLDAAVWLGESP